MWPIITLSIFAFTFFRNSIISKGEFSFQVRLSMGPDKWGGNITFIEDDIAISQAHVLGINPGKKVCCTPKKIKKAAEDWKRFKNSMYVVEGNSYQGKQKIIGKVVDIAGRTNGYPPGYDLLLLYIDTYAKEWIFFHHLSEYI